MSQIGTRKNSDAIKCKCDCGEEVVTRYKYLSGGNKKSCGCLKRETSDNSGRKLAELKQKNVKARWSKLGVNYRPEQKAPSINTHEMYSRWIDMQDRCYRPSDVKFKHYGGRGITVCERWRGVDGFLNFVADMGDRPKGHSLDRIDNNKGYSPENCRWATAHTQLLNRRLTKHATLLGETKTLYGWAKDLGLNLDRVRYMSNILGSNELAVIICVVNKLKWKKRVETKAEESEAQAKIILQQGTLQKYVNALAS